MNASWQKVIEQVEKTGPFAVTAIAIVGLTILLSYAQIAAAERLTLGIVIGSFLVVILGMLGVAVITRIATGEINLGNLIAEADGSASMSRFQFLIFTFVIAGSYILKQMATTGMTMPDIPQSVLGLMGISAGTYAGAKIVQKSAENTKSADDNKTTVDTVKASPDAALQLAKKPGQ